MNSNKNIEEETIVSKAEEKVNKISEESKKQIVEVVESTVKGSKKKKKKICGANYSI